MDIDHAPAESCFCLRLPLTPSAVILPTDARTASTIGHVKLNIYRQRMYSSVCHLKPWYDSYQSSYGRKATRTFCLTAPFHELLHKMVGRNKGVRWGRCLYLCTCSAGWLDGIFGTVIHGWGTSCAAQDMGCIPRTVRIYWMRCSLGEGSKA